MKKPTAVKIVEALGWAYVVLAALAWLGMALSYLRSTCFGCVVVSLAAVIVGLGVAIALPVGMLLSLRRGRRVVFLCLHFVVVCELSLLLQKLSLLQMWDVKGILFVLFVAPIVLLFRPEASRWSREASGDGKLGKYFCMAVFLTVLWIAFWNQATHIIDGTRRKSYYIGKEMASDARALFEAMEQNAKEHEAGTPWVDPSSYSNSTDFVTALCAKSESLAMALGCRMNIWCIVVNAPDYDKFPVLFTANLAPADLIRRDGRRRALTCPRDWGGVCWGHCRKYVVFVWKNGLAGYNDPRYMCPCPQMRLSELADTYVLTPTGRVALAGKVAAEQDADDAELPPDFVLPTIRR